MTALMPLLHASREPTCSLAVAKAMAQCTFNTLPSSQHTSGASTNLHACNNGVAALHPANPTLAHTVGQTNNRHDDRV